MFSNPDMVVCSQILQAFTTPRVGDALRGENLVTLRTNFITINGEYGTKETTEESQVKFDR